MKSFCWIAVLAVVCVAPVNLKAEESTTAVLEESLGVYTIQCVYQSYLNIGLIGDGVPKGVYEAKQAQDLLVPIINLIAAAKKQNEKLLASELKAEDKDYIKKINKILELLDSQATELKEYIGTKEKSHIEQYDQFRQLAWKKIEELLK